MLDIISEESPIMNDKHRGVIENFRDRIEEISFDKQHGWYKNNRIYMEWLVCYYAEQIELAFNQLNFIDRENLPIGLNNENWLESRNKRSSIKSSISSLSLT